jgi:hypothetical protein
MPRSTYSLRPCSNGQLDVRADGQPAGVARAAVGRLHDARPAAGDDREPLLDQLSRQPPRRAVVAVPPPDARRAEDADRRADVGQGVEALDELAHDPQRAPGIGLLEAPHRHL